MTKKTQKTTNYDKFLAALDKLGATYPQGEFVSIADIHKVENLGDPEKVQRVAAVGLVLANKGLIERVRIDKCWHYRRLPVMNDGIVNWGMNSTSVLLAMASIQSSSDCDVTPELIAEQFTPAKHKGLVSSICLALSALATRKWIDRSDNGEFYLTQKGWDKVTEIRSADPLAKTNSGNGSGTSDKPTSAHPRDVAAKYQEVEKQAKQQIEALKPWANVALAKQGADKAKQELQSIVTSLDEAGIEIPPGVDLSVLQ